MNLHELKQYALQVMHDEGLHDWTFKFDTAKKRMGLCNRRTKTIQMSKCIAEVNSDDENKDTIVHEIAHALTPGHNHDDVWRATIIRLGGKPNATAKGAVSVKGKYVYQCIHCGLEDTTHRKLKVARACGKCCDKYNYGRFSDKYLFEYKGTTHGN